MKEKERTMFKHSMATKVHMHSIVIPHRVRLKVETVQVIDDLVAMWVLIGYENTHLDTVSILFKVTLKLSWYKQLAWGDKHSMKVLCQGLAYIHVKNERITYSKRCAHRLFVHLCTLIRFSFTHKKPTLLIIATAV